MKLLWTVFLGIAACHFSNLAQGETFDDGLTAYHCADFATAQRIWRPLAELGDTAAQISIGLLYLYGQGVAKDEA